MREAHRNDRPGAVGGAVGEAKGVAACCGSTEGLLKKN